MSRFMSIILVISRFDSFDRHINDAYCNYFSNANKSTHTTGYMSNKNLPARNNTNNNYFITLIEFSEVRDQS